MRTAAFAWDQVLRAARHDLAGHYHIHDVLGVGAMGTVYRAERVEDGGTVALKVLHPGLLADARAVARFEREARTALRLDHPHIVRVYAARELAGFRCIEMAHVAGSSLRELLDARRQPLPLAIAGHWLAQIGSALACAHAHDVVHRDLNPGNVLLDTSGDAHVTDFGIAAVAGEVALSETGVTVGTLAYTSPEQLDGMDATSASDQYALGVVAYELIAGRRPFYGTTDVLMEAHRSELPAPLERWRPDCPPVVADAVARMLAKHPADRFPDLAHALEALRAKPLPANDPQRATLRALLSVSA